MLAPRPFLQKFPVKVIFITVFPSIKQNTSAVFTEVSDQGDIHNCISTNKTEYIGRFYGGFRARLLKGERRASNF